MLRNRPTTNTPENPPDIATISKRIANPRSRNQPVKAEIAARSTKLQALEKRQKIRLLNRLCLITLLIALGCNVTIFGNYFVNTNADSVAGHMADLTNDQKLGGLIVLFLLIVSVGSLWLNNLSHFSTASRIFTYGTLILVIVAYYYFYDLLPLMLIFMIPIALSIVLLNNWETILILILSITATLILFVGTSIANYYTPPIPSDPGGKIAATLALVLIIVPAITGLFLIPFKNQISLLQNQNGQLTSALVEIEGVLALAGELKSIAHLQDSGSQEQAANIMQLNTSGQELSSSAAQVNSVVAQIGEASRAMATQSQMIEKTTGQASQNTEVGRNAIKQTIETAQSATRLYQELIDTLAGLNQQNSSMHYILDNLEAIASQTQLLALNATIEAAGAGEHGRRFIAIADQVKRLAQQAENFNEEVSGIVEQIEGSSQNAANLAQQGYRQMVAMEQVVVQSGRVMTSLGQVIEMSLDQASQIKEQAQTVTELTILIKQATNQQQTIGQSLQQALVSLNEVAQQNAQGSRVVLTTAVSLEANSLKLDQTLSL